MSSWSEWYAKPENREKFNKRRRDKYAKDPDYRKKVRETTNASKRKKSVTMKGKAVRVVGDDKVVVIRVGLAADMIGCSQCTIRVWEDKGQIPKPTFGGSHRVYTEHQVALMSEMHQAIRTAPQADEKAVREQYKQILAQKWEGG